MIKNKKILLMVVASTILQFSQVSQAKQTPSKPVGGGNAGFISKDIDARYIYSVDVSKIMQVKPVPHRITSNVVSGIRELQLANGQKIARAHKGTDFASPIGTPIKAVSSGVVAFNAKNSGNGIAGFGYYTGIDHGGGYRTLYAHLSEFGKNPGEKVNAGDVVGYSGNTGGVSSSSGGNGAHLHFEITYNSFIIDPFSEGKAMPDYGDSLPRMEYGNPTDSSGYALQTNAPMPIINPITSFDCGTVEVSNYMSQLNYSNPKGMTNVPSVLEIEPAILKSKEIEYGAEANECLTIFNDGTFQKTVDSAKGLWDKLGGLFKDPVGTMTKAGEMAAERAKDMYKNMETQYKKGICQRLNNGDLKGAAIDHIEHALETSGSTRDTYAPVKKFEDDFNYKNLEALGNGEITREELVANHFTYMVVQNMMGKGSQDVNSVLQMDAPEYTGYLKDMGVNFIDGKLDDIEDFIFGR